MAKIMAMFGFLLAMLAMLSMVTSMPRSAGILPSAADVERHIASWKKVAARSGANIAAMEEYRRAIGAIEDIRAQVMDQVC